MATLLREVATDSTYVTPDYNTWQQGENAADGVTEASGDSMHLRGYKDASLGTLLFASHLATYTASKFVRFFAHDDHKYNGARGGVTDYAGVTGASGGALFEIYGEYVEVDGIYIKNTASGNGTCYTNAYQDTDTNRGVSQTIRRCLLELEASNASGIKAIIGHQTSATQLGIVGNVLVRLADAQDAAGGAVYLAAGAGTSSRIVAYNTVINEDGTGFNNEGFQCSGGNTIARAQNNACVKSFDEDFKDDSANVATGGYNADYDNDTSWGSTGHVQVSDSDFESTSTGEPTASGGLVGAGVDLSSGIDDYITGQDAINGVAYGDTIGAWQIEGGGGGIGSNVMRRHLYSRKRTIIPMGARR